MSGFLYMLKPVLGLMPTVEEPKTPVPLDSPSFNSKKR